MNSTMALPTIWEMVADLTEAGWVAKTKSIWASPSGKLYGGVSCAWKTMRSQQ